MNNNGQTVKRNESDGKNVMNELISVIVPVYKVEQYLDRCVESIICQTYENLEIILVDDGSPDSCPKICDDWAEKESRIKVIHKTNGGLSDARNAGMKKASGTLIGFVDSDDWIEPEMYAKLKEALDRDRSDIAACAVKMVFEDSNAERMFTVLENRVLNKTEAQKALLDEVILKQPVWYKLYKREVIGDIHFEKGRYHEDVYWSYQVFGNADKVSIIDYAGYNYRQRGASIMGESYSIKRLDAIEAFCRRYEYIKKEFPELSAQAKRLILMNCIYHMQMALKYLPAEEQKAASDYLESVKEKYPLKHKDYSDMKITHQLWLTIGSASLKSAAIIKNMLNVGL